MNSVSDLLVDAHLIRLGNDHIDKLIVLLMGNKSMERAWHKEALTSIIFQDVVYDEHVSSNEEW